ncbi:MAG: hypothetical protein AAFU54_28830 [Chloroflexota bacterium]
MLNMGIVLGTSFVMIVLVSLTVVILIAGRVLNNLDPNTARRRTLITGFTLTVWLAFQGILALQGFYIDLPEHPTRLSVALGPGFIAILLSVFAVRRGSMLVRALPLDWLTYLHTIRLPIEIVLLGLYINEMIPRVMTFEGWNYDILVGITAPVVGYLVFSSQRWPRRFGLIWNWISLALLINVVTIGLLSAPTPLQQIAFDQPNQAVNFFPYNWLVTFIVPIVFVNHILSIKRLLEPEASTVYLQSSRSPTNP